MSAARRELAVPEVPSDVVRTLQRNGPPPSVIDPDTDNSNQAYAAKTVNAETASRALSDNGKTGKNDIGSRVLLDNGKTTEHDNSSRALLYNDKTIKDENVTIVKGEELHSLPAGREAVETLPVVDAEPRKIGRPRSNKIILTGSVDRDVYAFVDERWTSLRDAHGLRQYRDRGEYLNAILSAVRENEGLVMDLVRQTARLKER